MRLITTLSLALALGGCGGSSSDEETSEETTGEATQGEASTGDEAAEEGSTLLAVGVHAPDFEAADQAGAPHTLAQELGHPVVLYFYPRDATPGCTTEACAFRDAWDRYQEAGVTVLGVSTDDVDSHRAFADEHELPFSLLADEDASISNAYGVSLDHGGLTMARRVTYLIDSEGNVAHVFAEVDPGVHADEVLEAVAELEDE